jgi:hypothetical protein
MVNGKIGKRTADVPTRWRIAIRDDDCLSSTAKTVGYVLSTFMDAKGLCWPSTLQIARGCGFKLNPKHESNRSAKRGTRELRDAGYVISKRRYDMPSVYQACFPVVGHGCPLLHAENGKVGDSAVPYSGDVSVPLTTQELLALRGDEQELRRDKHGEFVIEEDGTPSFE